MAALSRGSARTRPMSTTPRSCSARKSRSPGSSASASISIWRWAPRTTRRRSARYGLTATRGDAARRLLRGPRPCRALPRPERRPTSASSPTPRWPRLPTAPAPGLRSGREAHLPGGHAARARRHRRPRHRQCRRQQQLRHDQRDAGRGPCRLASRAAGRSRSPARPSSAWRRSTAPGRLASTTRPAASKPARPPTSSPSISAAPGYSETPDPETLLIYSGVGPRRSPRLGCRRAARPRPRADAPRLREHPRRLFRGLRRLLAARRRKPNAREPSHDPASPDPRHRRRRRRRPGALHAGRERPCARST